MKALADRRVQPVISAENLTKVFSSGVFFRQQTTAVNNVSFEMYPGTILSLIGESGSGKTTIGRMILKLLRPTSGKLYYKGQDVTEIRGKTALREYYRRVQGVFQDPFSSFYPLFRVDRAFDMVYDVFLPDVKNREERTREVLQASEFEP